MCNLMDNQTARKKAALVEVLKEHPVRKLFQAAERCLDMECELELESCDAEEVMEQGEIKEVVDETNPLHRTTNHGEQMHFKNYKKTLIPKYSNKM